jgi:hypothetical protein
MTSTVVKVLPSAALHMCYCLLHYIHVAHYYIIIIHMCYCLLQNYICVLMSAALHMFYCLLHYICATACCTTYVLLSTT